MRLLCRIIGFLTLGLFLVAEAHALWVLRPMSQLGEALIVFGDDALVPFQLRLASYCAGALDFANSGFLLPAAFGLSLGVWLLLRRYRS